MGGGTNPADRETRLRALFTTMARIRAFEDAAETASQGGVSAWGLEASGTPIQPPYGAGIEGRVCLDESYAAALDGI